MTMDIASSTVVFAFLLTILAGLSTGIGSAIAIFTKHTNTKFLSVSLGFSAGVMIYISMVELLRESNTYLAAAFGPAAGGFFTTASFFAGIILTAAIDMAIPSFENPHEVHKVEEMDCNYKNVCDRRLLRLGLFAAIAIAVHNFPEGLATFVSALKDKPTGISIALAIAIHNIPEGISIAVPVFYATQSRRKAFCYSFLSGLAEPLGAVAGWLFLMRFLSDTVFGVLFALVAGTMVFISFDELLPAAHEYGEHHHAVWGLISGMAVMALSLLLLASH